VFGQFAAQGGGEIDLADAGISPHAAGITVGHLSTIERGHSNPTWATVKAVASGLEAPLSELAVGSLRLESE
jgi:transcriptional regulator with XRE-family HTH domain